MAAEETLSSDIVFEGRIMKVRVDTVRKPNGRQSIREIVEHDEVITVVPVDRDDNVLMVKQFRKSLEKELLELPAGGIDTGEGPEAAVIREMQEEIGFRPEKLVKLGGFYSAPGFCTEYLHLYLATDLIPGRLHAEDTEGIEVVRIPVTQIPDMVNSGKLEDAKSIAGLLTYLEYRKTH